MYKISAFRKEPIHQISYEIEDENEDYIPELKVKFDRSEVQALLKVGEYERIVITGQLVDDSWFGGEGRIRMIGELILLNGWMLMRRVYERGG
jgi:hypothetical protein